MHPGVRLLAAGLLAGSAIAQAAPGCQATSRAQLTPVLELYTSEGCSSCPPADRWLSGLKAAAAQGRVVPQAFHVAYWDSLGWIDRFALAAGTARQKELAAANGLRTIARDGAAPRTANLVVFDPKTLRPLQALGLSCAG